MNDAPRPAPTMIRPLQAADSRRVAALHRAGIPLGFLSTFGDGFRAALYRGIARAPRSGVWVAVAGDGEVVGFVSGTAHVGRCYRSVLLRRGVALAWAALPALRRAATWRQAWETLTYPRREIGARPRAAAADAAEPRTTAELLSIVVDARGRGTGTAGRLVATLEAALRAWGHRGPYRVATMAADPRANAFYTKVGFRKVRDFRHHGVAMNLYHKDLDD